MQYHSTVLHTVHAGISVDCSGRSGVFPPLPRSPGDSGSLSAYAKDFLAINDQRFIIIIFDEQIVRALEANCLVVALAALDRQFDYRGASGRATATHRHCRQI